MWFRALCWSLWADIRVMEPTEFRTRPFACEHPLSRSRRVNTAGGVNTQPVIRYVMRVDLTLQLVGRASRTFEQWQHADARIDPQIPHLAIVAIADVQCISAGGQRSVASCIACRLIANISTRVVSHGHHHGSHPLLWCGGTFNVGSETTRSTGLQVHQHQIITNCCP